LTETSVRSLGVALLTAVSAIAALPAVAAADPPVVAIDAPEGIVNEPKRSATMRVLDSRRREDYSGRIGIEIRGFGSQRDPKRSYALETRKRSGENRNVSLLGMPEDDDWVLIASYRDESLLRNYVTYSTARWAGQYAARTRLVEVFVNDSYEGIYLLAEQLKVHENRVAVDNSDISGGYLLEMISFEQGRTRGQQFFTTPSRNKPIVYADPDRGDLSLARANWIRDYVNRFERRLYGDRFRSRRRGYRPYLDMDAAVDYVLLNELFRNQDTFRYSAYMHKGVGEKLVLGPLWDFDLSLGNSDAVEDNQRTGWQYGAYPWVERLYADPAFRRRMAARWRELQSRGIERHIMRTIDRGARQLAGGPQERNFSRWAIFERDRNRGPIDPRTGRLPANHGEAVDYLRWWLSERIRWIDAR
jgi:hypothetical protein